MKEMMYFDKQNVKASNEGMLGQLSYIPGIYGVWYSPWFPHCEYTSNFLLALKSCKPPAS
jgi:hypothetical protein